MSPPPATKTQIHNHTLTSLYEIHLTSDTLSEQSVSAICLR